MEREQVIVPKYNPPELIEQAFDDHARHGGEKTLEDCSIHDMNHILLNYIRHQMVRGYNYQQFEDQWQYFSWFCVINRKIAEVYPFLESTVEQQIRRKESKLVLQTYKGGEWEVL